MEDRVASEGDGRCVGMDKVCGIGAGVSVETKGFMEGVKAVGVGKDGMEGSLWGLKVSLVRFSSSSSCCLPSPGCSLVRCKTNLEYV